MTAGMTNTDRPIGSRGNSLRSNKGKGKRNRSPSRSPMPSAQLLSAPGNAPTRSRSLPRIEEAQWSDEVPPLLSASVSEPSNLKARERLPERSISFSTNSAHQTRNSRSFQDLLSSLDDESSGSILSPIPSSPALRPRPASANLPSVDQRSFVAESVSSPPLGQLRAKSFAAYLEEVLSAHPLNSSIINNTAPSSPASGSSSQIYRSSAPRDAYPRLSDNPATIISIGATTASELHPPGSSSRVPRRISTSGPSSRHRPSLGSIREDVTNGEGEGEGEESIGPDPDPNVITMTPLPPPQPRSSTDSGHRSTLPRPSPLEFQEPPEPLMSIGSLLFLFGFVLPLLWWLGAWWPRIVRTREDAKWRYMNRLMSLVSIILIALIVGVVVWYFKQR